MKHWYRLQQGDFSSGIIGLLACVLLLSACAPVLLMLVEVGRVMRILLILTPIGGAAAATWMMLAIRARLGIVQEAIDASQSAFVVYDADDRLVMGNQRYREVLRVPEEAFVPGAHYADLVRLSLGETVMTESVEDELRRRLRLQQVADGQPSDRRYPGGRWLRVTKTRTPSGANVGVAIDVTEYYRLRERLETEVRRFTALAKGAPAGICQVDARGVIHFVNDSLLEMLNVPDIEALHAESHAFSVEGNTVVGFLSLMHALQAKPTESEVQLHLPAERRDYLVRKAFVPTSDLLMRVLPPQHAAGENIFIFVDITDRKEAEERIRYLAVHDALTGALNRVAFAEDLAEAAGRAGDDHPVWLIAIDLDRFKPVNDVLGHVVGDKLLRQVVPRIAEGLDPTMRLYRTGGDEFSILCRGGCDIDLLTFANGVLDRLREPFRVEEHLIRISASIGLCGMPRDTQRPETLIHYADLSLYHVKNAGGSGVMMFDQTVLTSIDARRLMELDIADALQMGDITLVYQPVFGMDRRQPAGAEALARWRNRRTGDTVPPSIFIPVAENANLVERLDFEMFTTAVREFATWRSRGCELGTLSINMSTRTLQSPSVLGHVMETLERFAVPGRAIVIELTESFAVRNAAELSRTIREINQCGVRFAIDDFGTGYTSLQLLAELPISFVKIDQYFVRGLEHRNASGSYGVVQAIVNIARHMGIRVVAEGIETEDEYATLVSLGCDLFQGYLFGGPKPAADFHPRFHPVDAPGEETRALHVAQRVGSDD